MGRAAVGRAAVVLDVACFVFLRLCRRGYGAFFFTDKFAGLTELPLYTVAPNSTRVATCLCSCSARACYPVCFAGC